MWYGCVWKLGISWYIMVYPQTWWFRMSVFPLIGNLAGITNFQIQMGMGQNWYTLQNYQWIRGPRNLDPWLSLSLPEKSGEYGFHQRHFLAIELIQVVVDCLLYGALVWCQRTVGIYRISLGCTGPMVHRSERAPRGIDTVPGFVGPTAIISPGFA